MKNTKATKKLNKKGFSLIELIIVVAIMALLVGVLAPQYMQYVERSRESADIDSVDTMISAIEIYSADPAGAVVTGTLTCSNGAITPSVGTVEDALTAAGLPAAVADIPEMRSVAYQNWTITFAAGATTFSTGDDGDELEAALGR